MKSLFKHATVALFVGMLLVAVYQFVMTIHMHSHASELEAILAQVPK